MNNLNDQKLEEIIGKTLGYLDGGKSPAEILNLFPEHRAMLKEIFSTISLLKKEGESIALFQGLFKQVIEQILDGVTNETNVRYKYKKEVEGRPSLDNITTKIYDLMIVNWKVWAPLGIIAVVALVAIGSYQSGTKTPQAPVAEEKPQQQPVAVKPATGNIDDAVNAALASIADDQALFADAEKDAELIAADSQAISDFGQSYNENEF